MKSTLTLRLYALVFLLAILWVILGSPIFPDEWQHIPRHLAQLGHQLPLRMGRVFIHWH